MPFAQDIVTRIFNVQWGGEPKRFLYSGADGMFGSQTGEKWTKASSSVPATSLAFIDGVWIAAGSDGCWRSEDGAQSWSSGGPAFIEVAAMTPEGSTAGGGKKTGVFAGWLEQDDGDQVVYSSHDLGKTWSLALTIPATVGDDGNEIVRGLSGCGGGFFVCTVRLETATHNGDGMIYTSFDGRSFFPQRVFGPGTDFHDPAPDAHTIGYSADAVGFDKQGSTYMAVGQRNESDRPTGVEDSFVIYSESSSGHFGESDGTVAASGHLVSAAGDFVSLPENVAGGNRVFATGIFHTRFPGDGSSSGDIEVHFIPGSSQALAVMGTPPQGFIGSFCFNDFAELQTSTDGETAGVFACVVYDHDNAGGVYIASAGGTFRKTHAGSGITLSEASSKTAGAIAIGQVSFVGKD